MGLWAAAAAAFKDKRHFHGVTLGARSGNVDRQSVWCINSLDNILALNGRLRNILVDFMYYEVVVCVRLKGSSLALFHVSLPSSSATFQARSGPEFRSARVPRPIESMPDNHR